MALSPSSKPFVGASRTAGISGFRSSFFSDLRNLSFPSVQFSVRSRTLKKLQVQAAGRAFGNHFRVITYGESRGDGIGCVIDGAPPRIPLSEADLQADLNRIRRRPCQNSRITNPRNETDTCKIISGVHGGLTTGTPINVFVPNTDQRGRGYHEILVTYRPSRADLTNDMKYGIRSVQVGGGSFSGRQTIGRVVAGAVAKKILNNWLGIEVLAYVSQLHTVVLPQDLIDHHTLTVDQIESNTVRCPDPEYAEKMIAAIDAVRVRGDDQFIGGSVTCVVRNFPRSLLGLLLFYKVEAELAKACLSLPATKGFEFGTGIEAAGTLNMRIAFKPVVTIARKQNTVTREKQETELMDPCLVPRAVPMVEAGVALVLMDQLMAQYE